MNATGMPEYISTELFENALRSYFNNGNIQILQHTGKTPLPVGENYSSDIFRSIITYSTGKCEKEETISVIVKSFPENELMRNLVQKFLIFEGEAYIYKNILPAINNTLGHSEQISANCIHYVEGPNSLIIFEDLSVMNFKMHPRRQGLDLPHCLLVVEKIACLHAASLVLYEKDSSPINEFTEGIYGEHDFSRNWIESGFNALIEASSQWPGFEKFSLKLKAIQDQAFERTVNARKFGDFKVLNHGDCWINNLMFSYNTDGQVTDLRFVDFQIVLYGSPAIDLNYFFVTSPTIEVRNQHLDTILDHYHVKLTDTLNRLKYPLTSVPSRKRLWEDFKSRAFYGLAGAVTVLPLVIASSRNDASLEALIFEDGDANSFQHEAFNNELYRKHMEFLLPFYDNLGVLD